MVVSAHSDCKCRRNINYTKPAHWICRHSNKSQLHAQVTRSLFEGAFCLFLRLGMASGDDQGYCMFQKLFREYVSEIYICSRLLAISRSNWCQNWGNIKKHHVLRSCPMNLLFIIVFLSSHCLAGWECGEEIVYYHVAFVRCVFTCLSWHMLPFRTQNVSQSWSEASPEHVWLSLQMVSDKHDK